MSPAIYHEPKVQYLILNILGARGLKPKPDQAIYATIKFGATEARTRILVLTTTPTNHPYYCEGKGSEFRGPTPSHHALLSENTVLGLREACTTDCATDVPRAVPGGIYSTIHVEINIHA